MKLSPAVQLVAATAGMVGGAFLVGLWMVGVVLMVASLAWAVDALIRDDGRRK